MNSIGQITNPAIRRRSHKCENTVYGKNLLSQIVYSRHRVFLLKMCILRLFLPLSNKKARNRSCAPKNAEPPCVRSKCFLPTRMVRKPRMRFYQKAHLSSLGLFTCFACLLYHKPFGRARLFFRLFSIAFDTRSNPRAAAPAAAPGSGSGSGASGYRSAQQSPCGRPARYTMQRQRSGMQLV